MTENSLSERCICGNYFDTWDHCVCGKDPLLNSLEEKQYWKDLAEFWKKLPMAKEQ